MRSDGSAGFERWVLTEPRDLTRLWPGASFEKLGDAAFSAEVSRRTLMTLTIEGIAATPYAVRRSAQDVVRAPNDSLLLNVLCSGHGTVVRDRIELDVAPGSCFMLRPNEPFEYRCPVDTRTFRATVAETLLPKPLRGVYSPPFRLIHPTAVASAFANLASDLLDDEGHLGESRSSRVHLDAALVALEQGILAEELAAQQDQLGSTAELRRQVLEQIELQLRDPGLGPGSLAEHFSVSLRTVHKLFESLPETAADHIRRRRIEEAAAVLRIRDVTAADLAHMFGFRTRDTFIRAFTRQQGVTPTQYRNLRTRIAG